MTLEVATGSVPKSTAVGPFRTASILSKESKPFCFRARRRRLFLATMKLAPFLFACERRLFWSVTDRPAYSVKITVW